MCLSHTIMSRAQNTSVLVARIDWSHTHNVSRRAQLIKKEKSYCSHTKMPVRTQRFIRSHAANVMSHEKEKENHRSHEQISASAAKQACVMSHASIICSHNANALTHASMPVRTNQKRKLNMSHKRCQLAQRSKQALWRTRKCVASYAHIKRENQFRSHDNALSHT